MCIIIRSFTYQRILRYRNRQLENVIEQAEARQTSRGLQETLYEKEWHVHSCLKFLSRKCQAFLDEVQSTLHFKWNQSYLLIIVQRTRITTPAIREIDGSTWPLWSRNEVRSERERSRMKDCEIHLKMLEIQRADCWISISQIPDLKNARNDN